MLKKCLWSGVVLTAASVGMLSFPQASQAQRFGGGRLFGGAGMGGNWGGFGYPGYYGGYGMGNSVYYGNMGTPSYYSSWGSPGYYGSAAWGTSPYSSPYVYPGSNGYGNVNYQWNTPSTALAPGTSSYQSFYPPQNNAAHVTVRVPDPNAQLWFNDTQMPEQGMVREFNTPPLDTSVKDHHYTVRAKWMQGNQPVERTRTVHVQPGQNVMLDFTQAQSGENLKNRPATDVNSTPNRNTPAADINSTPNRNTPVPADINSIPNRNTPAVPKSTPPAANTPKVDRQP